MWRRMKRVGTFVWKVLVGAVVCQFPVTSVLAVGWSLRLAQRTAVKRWWKLSGGTGSFREACAGEDVLRPFERYPNWVLQADVRRGMSEGLEDASGFGGRVRAVVSGVGGSLWANGKLGVQGMLNVWVATILPIMLWAFGWYSGWDNSFNKGYEQYSVGIAISLSGVGLFLVVMLYLPMAQARQAVTGNWRSFYEFRTVWGLVKRRRLACLVLAGFFSLVSLPLAISRVVPIGMEAGNERFAAMSDAAVLKWANSYFFWVCAVGFVGYVFLRVLAARIYAGALLEAYQSGALSVAELGAVEGPVLAELGLTTQKESAQRHVAIRVATKAVSTPWRVAITAATLALWFSFVAQIYVSEFLVNHGKRGFVNQPLVHLPWFRYVPKALEESVATADARALEDEDGTVADAGVSE